MTSKTICKVFLKSQIVPINDIIGEIETSQLFSSYSDWVTIETKTLEQNSLKSHESTIHKADIQKIILLKLGKVLFFEPENLGLNSVLLDKVAEEI